MNNYTHEEDDDEKFVQKQHSSCSDLKTHSGEKLNKCNQLNSTLKTALQLRRQWLRALNWRESEFDFFSIEDHFLPQRRSFPTMMITYLSRNLFWAQFKKYAQQKMKMYLTLLCGNIGFFLAVQNSSIGDLVTQSLTHSVTD